jgi:hypothetical protein
MPESNGRQADVPERATAIPQVMGTAPGLICPVGHKVVYALPGVPYEMYEMFTRAVLPDLHRRMAERGEDVSVIVSLVVRTWGNSESGLAELLAPRIAALDAAGGNPTIAFLASGMEGIKVRITAKAPDTAAAVALLRAEEKEVTSLVGEAVFGFDDDTMESVVGAALKARGLSLGLAESLTGGLVASRLVAIPGASVWFRGSKPPGPWPTAPAGFSAPTWDWPSPGWPVPTNRRVGPRGRSSLVWPDRGRRPKLSKPICPGTATGYGSTPPSPPSTCCDDGCSTTPTADVSRWERARGRGRKGSGRPARVLRRRPAAPGGPGDSPDR